MTRYGRVMVQELSSAAACFQGVVTKVVGSGSSLVAQEALGPVTAFTALADSTGGWVQLLPVGLDDRSGIMAADFALEPLQGPPPPSIAAAACTGIRSMPLAPALSQTAQLVGAVQGEEGNSGRSAAGGGGQEPTHESQDQQQDQQHQAVLVAAHPAGLLLLQRYLQQEADHVVAMLQAAQHAWDVGHRPPNPLASGRGGILLRDPLSTVSQVWQGAGEAAPWAGGEAAGVQDELIRAAANAVAVAQSGLPRAALAAVGGEEADADAEEGWEAGAA